jgi:hypothetical protein
MDQCSPGPRIIWKVEASPRPLAANRNRKLAGSSQRRSGRSAPISSLYRNISHPEADEGTGMPSSQASTVHRSVRRPLQCARLNRLSESAEQEVVRRNSLQEPPGVGRRDLRRTATIRSDARLSNRGWIRVPPHPGPSGAASFCQPLALFMQLAQARICAGTMDISMAGLYYMVGLPQ